MKHTKFYEVKVAKGTANKKMHEHLIDVLNAKCISYKVNDVYKFSVDSDINDDWVAYLNGVKKDKKIKVKITTDLKPDNKLDELFE